MNQKEILAKMKTVLVNDMGIDATVIADMTQKELDKFCIENGCMLCCI